MLFTTLLTTLLAASASISMTIAAPTPVPVPAPAVAPQELIVFSPHITYPIEAVAWTKGSKQMVKWETNNLPAQTAESTGLIVLGHMENGSENLDFDHPIAKGFVMKHGQVEITVPTTIPARNDYFVVLFGDSGNKSPKFKIH